jgi:hypothetical protein
VTNTPDQTSGLVTCHWELKKTFSEQEERVKLFREESKNDLELRHYMVGYAINSKKFIEGLRNSPASRIIGDDYFRSLQTNYSFPVPKGTKNIVAEQMVTDAFLPPVPTETRFRYENKVFVKLDNEKKFRNVYTYNIFIKVKK